MTDQKRKQPAGTGEGQFPAPVISRMSLYLRELQRLIREGQETTSSTFLGQLLGFSDAQVRKDFAHFGQFGYPGIGYRCEELVTEIRRRLGTNREWSVAIVGIGNLGRALLGHKGFVEQGFRVVAAFDAAADVVGQTIEGIPVYGMNRLQEVMQQENIRLAMLAVPAGVAQSVAEQLVQAGVDGILNFAPVTITLPETVSSVAVDLAIELEQLTFAVTSRLSGK